MGTAAANPILSQGHHGKPWQERIAGAGFRSIAYSILLAVVLILGALGDGNLVRPVRRVERRHRRVHALILLASIRRNR